MSKLVIKLNLNSLMSVNLHGNFEKNHVPFYLLTFNYLPNNNKRVYYLKEIIIKAISFLLLPLFYNGKYWPKYLPKVVA